MKALKCKPSVQFAYNYTINVLSKYSNIIPHRSSVFEGRHNDDRSSKVGTSIIHLRRSTHLSSILEGRRNTSFVDLRKSTHRSSNVDTSIIKGRYIDLRRLKAETLPRQPNIPLTFRQFVTKYCPQRRSVGIPKILRGTYNIRRKYTCPYTYMYIRQQPHIVMYYTPIYIALYALVGGAISIRDPYICAVLRVCTNGSHAVFHRPVV